MDLNLVILKGRLGSPPQLRNPGESNAMCSFVLGTSEGWTDKGGQAQHRTLWLKCLAWGKLADACSRLRKGSEVTFTGKLTERTFQDAQGQERKQIEVQVIGFLREV